MVEKFIRLLEPSSVPPTNCYEIQKQKNIDLVKYVTTNYTVDIIIPWLCKLL